ncbi:MAG: DUF6765 family protein, partial [Patescibacteria group bacterium]
SKPVPSADAGEGDETTYYFLTDHLGSVDAVLDEDGNVVERRDYLPYGQERFIHEELNAPDTPQKFTGKELDPETGLYYYGARYYDPVTGRFITMDPLLLNLDKMSQAQRNAFLSNPQNLNMYSYVQNNPVRYTDPTGMWGEDVHNYLTLYLAVSAGLNFEQSKTIATADQYADENPLTSPGNRDSIEGRVTAVVNALNGTTNYYHFTTKEEALNRIADAISSQKLESFGTALHSYQDTYSHEYLNIPTHFIAKSLPDITELRPGRAEDTARDTFYLLRGLKFALDGSGDLTADEYSAVTDSMWEALSPIVEDYLGATDKSNTVIGKFQQKLEANKEKE